jgi:diguanylate cyclase (GGDEF)-like protein
MNTLAKWIWVVIAVALHGCGKPVATVDIQALAQLRNRPAADVRSAVAVHASGIVTYVDRFRDVCILQDATGGVEVTFLSGQSKPQSGMRLDVEGALERSGEAPAIANARLIRTRAAIIPPPLARSDWTFARPPDQRRVLLRGTVVSVAPDSSSTRTVLLRTDGVEVVMKVPNSYDVDDGLIDGEVSVVGVLGAHRGVAGRLLGYFLCVGEETDLKVTQPARPLNSLPVESIAALLKNSSRHFPDHRVRVKGALTATSQGSKIDDGSTLLETDYRGSATGDLAGFVTWRNGQAMLLGAVPIPGDGGWAPPKIISTARQVHQLTAANASLHQPVSFVGVITYCDYRGLCFVEDKTDGVFVNPDPAAVRTKPGDRVRVTGVAAPGDFAPVINRAKFEKLGRAPLPSYASTNAERSFLGTDDSRWISMEGVVQSTTSNSLRVSMGDHRFDVNFPEPDPRIEGLVDARVAVRGVCATVFNMRRQLLGMQMFTPDITFVKVLKAGARDPFSLPARSAGSLFNFLDGDETGHYVHLRGVVTLASGSDEFWIRDESGGVRIRSLKLENISRGDLLDVVGFPANGGLSPMLQGAVVRLVQHGASPMPTSISPADALSGRFDSELVELDARLVDGTLEKGQRNFLFESGATRFSVRLANSLGAHLPEAGTLVRITGICSMFTDPSRDVDVPQGFQIIAASSADLQVLRHPSWWNPERLQYLVLVTLFVIGIAFCWALLLRRQVVTQTATLRQRALQLEEARSTAESALQRARLAETLEQQKKKVVELIARDEPLESVLLEMARAIETQCNGKCSIQLDTAHGDRVDAAPSLTIQWREALQGLSIQTTRTGARHRTLKELSRDPQWHQFVNRATDVPASVFAAAVTSAAERVGLICVFYQERHQVTDTEASIIASWCGLVSMAYERRSLHDQLSYRARHDELTGLPNRVVLFERIQEEIKAGHENGSRFGILYLDLDGFKELNDTLGHGAGDAALRAMGDRMAINVRGDDTVARVGGDEFVIMLPKLECRGDADAIAQKIATAVEEPVFIEGRHVSLGASIGISLFPRDGEDAAALLRAADMDMYREKMKGKQARKSAATLLQVKCLV